jgi:hypothetical protein
MKRIFILFFFFTINYCAFSNSYYVSNSTGNDFNDGTINFPWKTLTKVNATVFSIGDSVLFKRGEHWNGQLIISSSGDSTAPLFFGAYGTGNKPIIDGTGYSNAIEISNKEFIIISSFEIASGNNCILIMGASAGLIILNDLFVHDPAMDNCISIKERTNITISYSELQNATEGCGISAYKGGGLGGGWSTLPCHNITVTNCYIHDNRDNGIYIAGHNALITNNVITRNGALGLWPRQHNIYLIGDNGLVKNNILTNSPGGDGFRYEGSNLRIAYNFIKNNELHGISISNDFPDTLKNNHVFYNMIIGRTSNYGVFTYSSGTGLFDSIYIYNNSICATTTDFTAIGLFNGSNIFLKNNLIDVKDKSIVISALCANTLQSDYNCFNSERIDQLHMYNPYGGPTDISLATWQTSGNDLNSIEADPLIAFSPPDTTFDFMLTSSSACINSGVTLGLSSDFFGQAIVNTPDIGACEYTPGGFIISNFSEKSDLMIYPNPADDYVYLHYNSIICPILNDVEIYNAVGEKMQTKKISKDDIIEINLENFSEGLYLIAIKNASFYHVKKLLVKHR